MILYLYMVFSAIAVARLIIYPHKQIPNFIKILNILCLLNAIFLSFIMLYAALLNPNIEYQLKYLEVIILHSALLLVQIFIAKEVVELEIQTAEEKPNFPILTVLIISAFVMSIIYIPLLRG